MNEKMNTEIIDKLIIGRVKPKIYAFKTNTLPDYTKVGDTFRPIERRLNEWRRIYPGLSKKFEADAKIDEDTYFRDYSVHKFLEDDLKKERLSKIDIESDQYYSNEFFKFTSENDLINAISDIKKDYESNSVASKYNFYNFHNKTKVFKHLRGESWELRPNQKEVVDNFKNAINNGRHNLLMYAVMRFGKTFTSLCCAKEINAKSILVVSAKADVKEEWKKTVETAGNFKGFDFITSIDLEIDEHILENTLENNRTFVLFLTLQDLLGDKIKKKHKEVFNREFDMLIVDETHFGARAEELSKTILDNNKILKKMNDDEITYTESDEIIKVISSKIRLHLSGTPYRILMGSEFSKEDIISFVQFTDIVNEQSQWDYDNLENDLLEEWDNPYYGFPEMIRFALLPNKSSLARLKELESVGNSFSLTKLFEPKSIIQDNKNSNHLEFKYQKEILEFLEVIDGTRYDENIFGFLDYDRFKEGKLLQHIVMVLPYIASCDAMEELIRNNRYRFKNLSEYELINISGFNGRKKYKSPGSVKKSIEELANKKKKSITFTVNRMLTGSTVEQWDTMLYLKESSSPQEYDQAIFRLQNQHIRELVFEENIIKENLKPQTILIDFDPGRLFRMQEQKALIYNANVLESGNFNLKTRIEEELYASPLLTLNKNKFEEVQATNILEYIADYNRNKSIVDEVIEIPVDLGILDDIEIYEEMMRQPEFGSKQGLTIKPHEGVEKEIVVPDSPNNKDKINNQKGNELSNKDKEKLENQIRTYYQRILFYSFLVDNKVCSTNDIVTSLNNKDNIRLSKNLGIDKNILIKITESMGTFILSDLDYKIQNISKLSSDHTIDAIKRSKISLSKFNRISETEVFTPSFVCSKMIESIPNNKILKMVEEEKVFFEMGSKSGEFTLALYEKMVNELGLPHEKVKNLIYSLPTSTIAYEFTRKVYDILNLNINNIIKKIDTYSLIDQENKIDLTNEFKTKEGIRMKFGAIIGNPPYNQSDGGAGASSKPIYNEFINIARELSPDYISLIIPTRWFAGGKGLENFRKEMINDTNLKEIHDFLNPEVVFPSTNNRGGVCYFVIDKQYDSNLTRFVTYNGLDIDFDVMRDLKTEGTEFIIRDSIGVGIISKVFDKSKENFSTWVSPRKPFGLSSNIVNTKMFSSSSVGLIEPISCLGRRQTMGYIEKKEIPSNLQWIDRWKVFTPRANNIGTELLDDNLNTTIGEPGSICTEAYLTIGCYQNITKVEAENISKYLQTKFARFMHKLAKASHDASRKTFSFVPVENFGENSDIDWYQSIDHINDQLISKYKLSEKESSHIEKSILPM